ncbi:MAG: radical SAM protein [bacterium]
MTNAQSSAFSSTRPARDGAAIRAPRSLSFKPGTVFDVAPMPASAPERPFDLVAERTRSVCPNCQRLLDAELVVRGDDLYMRKRCPEHGLFDLFFSRDQRFVREVRSLTQPPADGRLRKPRFEDFGGLRSLLIDVTDACNMACPNCITDSRYAPTREPDMAALLESLRAIPGRKPIVYLIGGEPTLRKDLVPFLATLVREGFIVKLETNGIRLVDESYCQELKDAGLEWVYLQWDSLREPTLEKLRARPMSNVRRRALENCIRFGFKVLLACMIEKDENDREIGELLEFARTTPQVFTISLLPSSRQGRNELTDAPAKIGVVDVIEEIERATHGQIAKRDFLWFLRALRLIHRVTGNPDYKPRSCLLHLAYYHDGDALVPLNRLLHPLTLARHWRAVPRLWPLVRNFFRIDRTPYSKHLSFVVVEALLDRQTIDFREASDCDKAYLTEDGYSLLCSYNALERGVAEPVLPA